MTHRQRRIIEQQVQAALARRALEAVEQAPGDAHFLPDIPDRAAVADATAPVVEELRLALRQIEQRAKWRRILRSRALIAGLLVALLAVGAGLRLHRIARQSLGLDEYWAVYLATGRGQEIFQLPRGELLVAPPRSNLIGAPPAWHVWRGLAGVTHPPLYYLALRLWMDIFGDGDFSVRALSAACGLAAALLLFDAVRRASGSAWQGLAAAAMLTLAPAQIDFSQLARPYTMIPMVALLAAEALLLIRQYGAGIARWIALLAAMLLLALTHYFAAGVVAGMAMYSAVGLRGRARWFALTAIAAAVVVAAIAWGPWALSPGVHAALADFIQGGNGGIEQNVLTLPRRLAFDAGSGAISSVAGGYWTTLAIAVATYVLPLLWLRRQPALLLWWLWLVCAVGFLLGFDAMFHKHAATVTRYLMAASPAVFALLAAPWPGRLGWLPPMGFCVAVACACVVHVQAGSEPAPDLRVAARALAQGVEPGDAVVVGGSNDVQDPSFLYMAMAHYDGDWRNPVVLLDRPADAALRRTLAAYPRVWVARFGDQKLLPGWPQKVVGRGGDVTVTEVQPVR